MLNGLNVVPVWSNSPGKTWARARYASMGAKGFNSVRFVLYWDDFERSRGRFDQTSLATLDTAVGRVLALKFRLGLFERPYAGAREPDPADGRASLVRITDEGLDRFRRVRDARRGRYVLKLADWDRGEIAELARLLHQLNARFAS